MKQLLITLLLLLPFVGTSQDKVIYQLSAITKHSGGLNGQWEEWEYNYKGVLVVDTSVITIKDHNGTKTYYIYGNWEELTDPSLLGDNSGVLAVDWEGDDCSLRLQRQTIEGENVVYLYIYYNEMELILCYALAR